MEAKKSNKSNLERKRFMFFQIGAIFALALTLVALRWQTAENFKLAECNSIDINSVEEMIPITRPPQKKQPPALPDIKTNIVIKDNLSDIIETDIIFSVDIDATDLLAGLEPYDEEPEDYDDTPFIHVEQMPEFMGGGLDAFRRYVMTRLDYPKIARDNDIQGTVHVNFVVNRNGELIDVKILRGVDPLLDNEVLSVLKDTPKWEPGKQRGNPVNVIFTMPVSFRLN